MVAVEKNQPATVQNINKPVRDLPELSKSKSALQRSFCSTSQFLAHGGSPAAFIIAKASTQKKTRALLCMLASLLCHSMVFLQFACGVWHQL